MRPLLLALLLVSCASDKRANTDYQPVPPRIDAQPLAGVEPSPVIANASVTLRVLGMT